MSCVSRKFCPAIPWEVSRKDEGERMKDESIPNLFADSFFDNVGGGEWLLDFSSFNLPPSSLFETP